jgi:hypothetical protein
MAFSIARLELVELLVFGSLEGLSRMSMERFGGPTPPSATRGRTVLVLSKSSGSGLMLPGLVRRHGILGARPPEPFVTDPDQVALGTIRGAKA